MRIVLGLLICFVFPFIAKAETKIIDQESLDRRLRQEAIVGMIPRIEAVLKEGANINGQALHGESPLEYAVRFGRHKAAIRLVELGANPDVEDDSGVSPLYRAAGDCNASRVVGVLLDAGANVNHRDLYGRTALMNAVHSNCARTVVVLLQKGKNVIDIDARNDSFQSAADLARNGLVPDILGTFRKYQQRESKGDLQFSVKLN